MKVLLSPFFWFGLLVTVAIGYILYVIGALDWLINPITSWLTPATTTATIGIDTSIVNNNIISGGTL